MLATGHCDMPAYRPALHRLGPDVRRVSSAGYRNPAELPPGGVLVVGASASGVQIADELARSGRRVVLAVGAHTRVPRRYRGRDVMIWLDRLGPARPPGRARSPTSTERGANPRCSSSAVPAARTSTSARCSSRACCSPVGWPGRPAGRSGSPAIWPARPRTPTSGCAACLPASMPTSTRPDWPRNSRPPNPCRRCGRRRVRAELDLAAADVSSVVTATGYRRAYPWLQVPVLDAAGEIRQRGGRTPVPGLYVVGMRFQTRRNSTFIGGARHDAALVVDAIAARGGATATSTLRRAG